MADYRTEEEQIELLKKWWKENGKSTVVGAVLSIFAFTGWQFWTNQQRAMNEAAADVYQQMIVAYEIAGGGEKAGTLAEQLRKDYASTVYAVFAALQLAREAVVANDLPRAASLLVWALEQKPDASLMPLISLRLAQVQYASGELESALQALSKVQATDVWHASSAELKGDILLAQGKNDEAMASYASALTAMDSSADPERRAALEIKMSALTKQVKAAVSAGKTP
jgi:predicted negative regulator of RcsB-dependent stress response